MKINIALLAMVILVFGVGCSQSLPVQNYYMKATINNNAYNAVNCIARPSGTALIIEGLGTSSALPVYPYIAITIPNWTDALDSYAFDSSKLKAYAQYYSSLTSYEISANGVVFINTVSTNSVSGLFQFTCTDSTHVTTGTFTAQREP